jgi:hypothetical protein
VLRRFTRALGYARSGRPAEARAEVASLDAIARDLEERHEPY